MNTADKLRYFTNRSNQLHQKYLADPDLRLRYERFVSWQIAYMLPFYAELRQNKDTRTAIDFVVSDLAGIGISERDHDIHRVVPAMIRILPASALRTIATGMEMNARILEINLLIRLVVLVLWFLELCGGFVGAYPAWVMPGNIIRHARRGNKYAQTFSAFLILWNQETHLHL